MQYNAFDTMYKVLKKYSEKNRATSMNIDKNTELEVQQKHKDFVTQTQSYLNLSPLSTISRQAVAEHLHASRTFEDIDI